MWILKNNLAMGSCITKLLDDYDTYLAFCELVNETPVSIDNYYEHQQELMYKHGYVQDGCWFRKI